MSFIINWGETLKQCHHLFRSTATIQNCRAIQFHSVRLCWLTDRQPADYLTQRQIAASCVIQQVVHKSKISLWRYKAWFPLNVSLLATNRSCLLARTLLSFASFHKQPSSDLLRGILYLEVCKSSSASGIKLEITIFRKSLLYFFLFWALVIFLSYVIGSHRSQSQHITAQASQKFNMCDFVASMQAFIAKTEIVFEQWCPYIEHCYAFY